MFNTIIKKEILNNIFSFRFLVTLILLVVIVTVTVFILTDDYVKKVDEFSRRQQEKERYLKEYAHFNRIGAVLRPIQPPISFYSFVRGLSTDVNMEEFHNDPLPVMFPLIDLTFIVTILMSLVALLFSYDSICGEKEDGTLKMILSYDISRTKLLFGKIIGGSLTLLIPYVFSLFVGLFVILVNSRVQWTVNDWGAFGFILVASIIFIMLFYSLGIFISSRHFSSSSSIMTSLFVWVLLILIIPNLSPYAASFLSKTPSRIRLGREISRITDMERDDLGRKLSQEKRQEIVRKYPILAEEISRSEREKRVTSDSNYRMAYNELTQAVQSAWDEANRIQGEKAEALRTEYNRKEEAQTRLSTLLSMLSPLSNFIYLSTDISSTGIRNMIHFNELSRKWSRDFRSYREEKIDSLREDNPTINVWNSPVDMSDRPLFQYRQEALGDRFVSTLKYFVALFIFNLIFFSAASVSFVRYDVR